MSEDATTTQDAAVLGEGLNFAADWFKALPEGTVTDADHAMLERFKDVPSLAKGFVETKRMMGADKVSIPSEHDTDEERRDRFKKLGWPDSPDAYKLAIPENAREVISEDLLKSFVQSAHENYLMPAQASNLWGKLVDLAVSGGQRSQSETKAKQATEMAELRKVWGNEWRQQVELARRVALTFAPDEEAQERWMSALESDASVVRFLNAVGRVMSEDRLKGMGPEGEGGDLQQRIKQLQEHPGYGDREHPEHKKIIEEMNKLSQALHD